MGFLSRLVPDLREVLSFMAMFNPKSTGIVSHGNGGFCCRRIFAGQHLRFMARLTSRYYARQVMT
jgi:hypothetical protein